MTFFLPRYRKAQNPEQTHFCPGCGHGSILKFVDDAVAELGCMDRVIWVSPVGCGGLTDSYLSVSHVLSAHGRASAVATAVKRMRPDAVVIASQGDGDLASIGLAEAIHAAARGENITVIFINNANFGMTGGQMAPTTVEGQRTPTSPDGRMLCEHGAPLRICELLDTLEGPAFIARVAIGDIRQLAEAKRVIKKAVRNQLEGNGYSFVEVLSPCPSNWHCSPKDARAQIVKMCETFRPGVFRDTTRRDWVEKRHRPTDYAPENVRMPFGAIASAVETLSDPPIVPENAIALCCAGFGGQGVLSLGRWLSHLALVSGLNATWIPSYGPEMRGGVANCFVRVARNSIDSPVVSQPTHLVAMNQPSLERFISRVAPDGYVFYDSDMAEIGTDACACGLHVFPVAATSVAQAHGFPRNANCVMLGALLRSIPVHSGSLFEALQGFLNPGQIEMVRIGMGL